MSQSFAPIRAVTPSTAIGSVAVHPYPDNCWAIQSAGVASPIGREAMFRNRWSPRTGSCSTSRPGLLNSATAGRSVQGSVAARATHPPGYDTENPCIVEVKLWVSGGAEAGGPDAALVAVGAGVGDGVAEGALPTPPGVDGPSTRIPM